MVALLLVRPREPPQRLALQPELAVTGHGRTPFRAAMGIALVAAVLACS